MLLRAALFCAACLADVYSAARPRSGLWGHHAGSRHSCRPVRHHRARWPTSGCADRAGQAARTLGAGPVRAFLSVTLPWLSPAIAGAAVLALLESFDDFLRSFFLGGYRPTLPVLLDGRLFSGLTPEINVIAALVLALTISIGLAGERMSRRKSNRRERGMVT
jgi:ABC-type spermidine/putrescine transport system permease subunit II